MTTPTTPIEQVFSVTEQQTEYLSGLIDSLEYASDEQKKELLNPINRINSLLQKVVDKVKKLPTTKPVKQSTIWEDVTDYLFG